MKKIISLKRFICILFLQFIFFMFSCENIKNGDNEENIEQEANFTVKYHSNLSPKPLYKKQKRKENREQEKEYKNLKLKIYDETIKSDFKNLEIGIKSQLNSGIYSSYLIFESEDFIITYEPLWGIFTIGSNLMMLDLDYKDISVEKTEEAIVKKLTTYANYHNLTFAYRLSDRGVHVFLVSKTLDKKNLFNNSDESENNEIEKIMFETDCEDRYIIFSKLRNVFTARIGPKPFEINSGRGPGTELRTKEDLQKEFISKRPLNDIIGDKNLVDKSLYNLLLFIDNLVSFIYDSYQKYYETIWSKTQHYFIHEELRNFVKTEFIKKIKESAEKHQLSITGTYPCNYKGEML